LRAIAVRRTASLRSAYGEAIQLRAQRAKKSAALAANAYLFERACQHAAGLLRRCAPRNDGKLCSYRFASPGVAAGEAGAQ
jgi:hypothetical protein